MLGFCAPGARCPTPRPSPGDFSPRWSLFSAICTRIRDSFDVGAASVFRPSRAELKLCPFRTTKTTRGSSANSGNVELVRPRRFRHTCWCSAPGPQCRILSRRASPSAGGQDAGCVRSAPRAAAGSHAVHDVRTGLQPGEAQTNRHRGGSRCCRYPRTASPGVAALYPEPGPSARWR